MAIDDKIDDKKLQNKIEDLKKKIIITQDLSFGFLEGAQVNIATIERPRNAITVYLCGIVTKYENKQLTIERESYLYEQKSIVTNFLELCHLRKIPYFLKIDQVLDNQGPGHYMMMANVYSGNFYSGNNYKKLLKFLAGKEFEDFRTESETIHIDKIETIYVIRSPFEKLEHQLVEIPHMPALPSTT